MLQLYEQHNVILLLDAFDKISPHYKDKVLSLLDVLLETSLKQLIITTRQHMTVPLEDKLSVLSYNLQPLSRGNQIQFLKTYWSKKLNLQLDCERSKKYISELLKNFSKIANSDISKDELYVSENVFITDREFTGIPLLIRMLAETYEDAFKIFFNSGEDKIHFSGNNEKFSLYKRVIAHKIEIYCKEKIREDVKNPAATDNRGIIQDAFLSEHRLFALDLLYSNEELKDFLSESERRHLQQLKDKVVAGNERRGMVCRINSNKPIFIHRTFAEYFAADCLSINIENLNVNNFLQKKYFGDNFNVQRYFFNRFLTKDDKFAKHKAVLNGDTLMLKNILKIDIKNTDKAGRTALHLAAAQGDCDMTKILLEQNADVHTRDMFGWTPISYADRSNNWYAVELLLQSGADGSEMYEFLSNIKQRYGDRKDTLLHIAAKKGYTKLLELLLGRGDNLNLVNYKKRTALHEAVVCDQFDTTKLLLKHNANIEACDNDNLTPLHIAAIFNSFETVQCLLEHNANIEARDNNKYTPLIRAAFHNSIEIVRCLVEHKANIKARNHNKYTPLIHAAIYNSIETVQCLVEHNANIEAYDKNNCTPLHTAAIYNRIEIVQYLVEHNANIDSRDIDNLTPLSLAIAHVRNRGPIKVSNLRIIKYFVEHGAGIAASNTEGRTQLDKLVEDHLIPSYKVLDEAKPTHEPRHAARCLIFQPLRFSYI